MPEPLFDRALTRAALSFWWAGPPAL